MPIAFPIRLPRNPAAADLDTLVTGRSESLFANDISASSSKLLDRISGRRILVIGGGGSIGSATTALLTRFQPAAIHVVDHSENYLAELVRNLRGRREGIADGLDFRTFPLDYGSPIAARLLADMRAYDAVLNFAALKHVRSEKDIFSLLQMIDTNLVRHARFKEWLKRYGHASTYFAVSTDKAANPTSLMGASKRLMEDLIFAVGAPENGRTTSARFANVAFSNGSLLQNFGLRLAARQPIAVPRDTRRYFVTQAEAAEICVLATFLAPDGHIVFPHMEAEVHLQPLENIAARFLAHFGFEPEFYEDEDQARNAVDSAAARDRWPVLLTPLDTSGEKPYEEFLGHGEKAVEIGLPSLAALRHVQTPAVGRHLFEKLEELVNDPNPATGKEEVVRIFASVLANFRHIETGRNLDQRL
ncbi:MULTISPECIES: polysaccharide biosynthesis protein [unclassified Mesorhizobium]|uniref:polysaccharide biosynthesis protein n=1 Tax=unclassified Mesorhizobium TaxID=325217 RepID=UPI000F7526EF|nr:MULTISPECIES: polysaccharide biosynthesis protein [unclassified Mesorhizobium]AZO31537.1 NAD-dependent epimerase/dehydratase family protein [Mesorhizobium sp. M1B.F.Ca.ET.045.04.1.1]RWB22892.1 MAG: NAD-dependent epimerase/dehydratase family protein [Mesorhizobium sp.]